MKIKKQVCFLGLMLLLGLLTGCQKNKEVKEEPWNVISAIPTEEGLEVKIVGENLLRSKKVKLKADSVEDEKYSVKMLTDGITGDESLRWSSENNWENSEHWVEVEFSEKTEIGAVKLFWERLNVCDYSLEISEDRKQWKEIFVCKENPKEKEEAIVPEEEVITRFLRLHIKDVNKLEEDFSLYYQNVSLLEFQVFGPLEDEFTISSSCVKAGKNRMLELPQVPQEYEVQFLGAEHESLISVDGKVADTIADTCTGVGLSLSKEGKTVELPSMNVKVPASEEENRKVSSNFVNNTENQEGEDCAGEWVSLWKEQKLEETYGFEPMEWLDFGAILQTNEATKVEYQLLEEELRGLGEEGFQLTINEQLNEVLIEGKTQRALQWGEVTLEKMLESNGGKLPAGIMRDYPSYKVRGFGIDVGRRPISLDLLYEMVEAMSGEKMNSLLVHLNDNQIITQSGYDGTMEGARNLYAGFRLESDIKNQEGVGITSEDLFYTKEEFSRFVEEAKKLGVEVIPEIDTPGHSLSLVKVFPELGIKNPETADLLDISKKEARELVKSIWKEYLVGEESATAVFEHCDTIHIGMDEYFGKPEEYISFLVELSEYLKEIAPTKQLRMWGSLTGMDCDYRRVSKEIQIQLWSTDWANPQDMYKAGFDLINSQNTCLYLVPGSGYDWLDVKYLAEEWEPNVFKAEKEKWEIPSYSPQMLGACYMLWNDMVFHEGMYISEEEIFARFEVPLNVIAEKLWR